jgi:hypothetical protein
MQNKIIGQLVRVQTTADECVRITIDIDSNFLKDINIIAWKNEMVSIELIDSVINFEHE